MLRPIFAFLPPSSSSSSYFVEIRRDSLETEQPTGTHTQLLAEQGWQGLLIDSTHHDPARNMHAYVVTPENVVALLDTHNVPLEPDYVSIDLRSVDVWVARRLLNSKYRYVCVCLCDALCKALKHTSIRENEFHSIFSLSSPSSVSVSVSSSPHEAISVTNQPLSCTGHESCLLPTTPISPSLLPSPCLPAVTPLPTPLGTTSTCSGGHLLAVSV